MTFFQSENPQDPTWITPREMLRDLGKEAQIHAGYGCAQVSQAQRNHSLRSYTRKRALIPACWCSPTLHSTLQIPACEGHISTVPKTPGQKWRAEQREVTACNGVPLYQVLCNPQGKNNPDPLPLLGIPPQKLPNGTNMKPWQTGMHSACAASHQDRGCRLPCDTPGQS